ncbi:uncharacterized protein MELLADRAFT_84347 [Melampsora larici-populina 98AG31]|uniref:Uncharacterized protein n=1 Tax=Melampsora larici-populina (strain 98AG31 / pathotype 3-4-7) TaxID=747676 RepID=F4RFF2_MELLP|nr:uncharacterized protein MELLADRAFT_84347 [Melampsora larici-populina 98AG31]EGG08941.1 hypothetical protein MELLADRAFT_84347 [Melampsora larici-populina 98AG31]
MERITSFAMISADVDSLPKFFLHVGAPCHMASHATATLGGLSHSSYVCSGLGLSFETATDQFRYPAASTALVSRLKVYKLHTQSLFGYHQFPRTLLSPKELYYCDCIYYEAMDINITPRLSMYWSASGGGTRRCYGSTPACLHNRLTRPFFIAAGNQHAELIPGRQYWLSGQVISRSRNVDTIFLVDAASITPLDAFSSQRPMPYREISVESTCSVVRRHSVILAGTDEEVWIVIAMSTAWDASLSRLTYFNVAYEVPGAVVARVQLVMGYCYRKKLWAVTVRDASVVLAGVVPPPALRRTRSSHF